MGKTWQVIDRVTAGGTRLSRPTSKSKPQVTEGN